MSLRLVRIAHLFPVGGVIPSRHEHRHDCHEMVLLLRGGYRVSGLPSGDITLHPGQAVLIPATAPHAPHFGSVDGTTELFCLGWTSRRSWSQPLVVDDHDGALGTYLRQLRRVHESAFPSTRPYAQSLLRCVELEVERIVQQAPPAQGIAAVKAHLDRWYAQPLAIIDLCRMFGIGRSALFAAFIGAYGTTPHRHVRQLRAEAARHLLTSTGLSPAVIAKRVGLANADQLTRLLRQFYGLTASEAARRP